MSKHIYIGHNLTVTRFAGGLKRGVCYQLDAENAVFTESEFNELISTLINSYWEVRYNGSF
jgi:hypothetical protein